ncbi:DeoR/GlpR family DNA-binding transcription regulator [Streptomyces geranii]|uniref:DeoR/GlpR family DNA-binding transcription regulator n=1 Tax=Streptomyces geranii TaxID=2058923 RepID=UPI0013004A8B|nr:DeoR/GlpR family DNA-binding transcription regulator [Streptomyces geranii]
MAGTASYEREMEILRLLDVESRVSVTELSSRFSISPVTIRKDLEMLERRRLLRRVRGGAVRTEHSDEGAFELRLLHRAEVKRAIAREAARLVRDGDAIALDCSTTCYYLAEQLRDRQGLVVVTNGLRAAELLGSSATVVLTGGTLRPSSWSLVGDDTDFPVRGGPLGLGFFGVRSVSPAHGLLELSNEEGAAKRRLGAACRKVYALFDSSKVSRFAMYPFVPVDRISGLITDAGFPDEAVPAWRAADVTVHRVTAVPQD